MKEKNMPSSPVFKLFGRESSKLRGYALVFFLFNLAQFNPVRMANGSTGIHSSNLLLSATYQVSDYYLYVVIASIAAAASAVVVLFFFLRKKKFSEPGAEMSKPELEKKADSPVHPPEPRGGGFNFFGLFGPRKKKAPREVKSAEAAETVKTPPTESTSPEGTPVQAVIKIVKEDTPLSVEPVATVEEQRVVIPSKPRVEKTEMPERGEAPAQPPTPPTSTPPPLPQELPSARVKLEASADPSEWILDCIGGYDFWPADKGPLPKAQLEVEFKKRFPNITIANFNSMVYDMIYKEKVVSEVVGGVTTLQLTPATKAQKAAEWNSRSAQAKLVEAQVQARRQEAGTGERRREWIELSPQGELGSGGPWDDLNKKMREMKWFGRTLTSGAKELKAMMWHREPPVQELQPPKAYYPNILLEWRQGMLGKEPVWHIEGVNISEDAFRKMMAEKTWSSWLSKNKVVLDVTTWEEAVVKVLEMGKSFVF
jgi:hypothetical protein